MMQRRIFVLFVAAAAFIFFTGSFLFGGLPDYADSKNFRPPTTHNVHEAAAPAADDTSNFGVGGDALMPPPKSYIPYQAGGPLHITITETGGSHDEVVAALVHSFGSQPNALIDLYQLLPRYNISTVMSGFTLANTLPKPKMPLKFIETGVVQRRPDVFVAGTCEHDILYFPHQLGQLLAERRTYMFCVVHHADRWGMEKLGLEDAIRPWVEAGMVEFLMLSPHTAKFMQEFAIKKWKTTAKAKVRYFVPVFPVPLPEEPAGNGADKEELSFGLQGDYDPARRNYNTIFLRLVSFLKSEGSATTGDGEISNRNITMHLLGHGKHPDVPLEVHTHVKFDDRLDYIDFYSLISRTFALLPAFASEEYLDRKASSSVPAALIGGVPLVATQSIIDAYSYLNHDVVWLQSNTETDFDVVERILNMAPEERRKKKGMVRKRCADIVKENTKLVGSWIGDALQKLRK